ncbi:MAG: hypothetical protein ACYC5F_04945 [Thermoleophilia bacterium]
MPAKGTIEFKVRRFGPTELSCSWCGSGVPLPAGEFSGVCIDCGTVMFRNPLDAGSASERSLAWSLGGHLPVPAV